jgi:predicted RNA-binding Zn-ribbon protein involved in translation (DUF1610 family)
MNRRALSILMVFLLFSAMPLAMIGSYGDTTVSGGYIECDTSLQMIPMTGTIGGGTIDWKITGESAKELRTLILDRLDNINITYERKELGPKEDPRDTHVIDEAEIWAFVGAGNSILQYYLEGKPKMGWSKEGNTVKYGQVGGVNDSYPPIYYHGVQITSSRLRTYDMLDLNSVSGLLGTDNTSDDPIEISMTISMKDFPKNGNIDMFSYRLFSAPFECLDMYEKENGSVTLKDNVTFKGNGKLNHFTIEIGFDSYSYPNTQKGKIWMLRTPAGEMFSYSVDVENGMAPKETIWHSSFNVIENPQILFIAIAIFGYLTVAFPTHYFLEYRNAYPKRYRLEARKIKWIHWTGRIFLLLLLIFYFFPIIGPIYFSGLIMIGISILFVVVSAGLSKVVYEKAIENIPKEYFEEKRVKKIKKAPAPAVSPVPEEYGSEPLPMYGEEEEEERIHCIKCGSLIKIKEGENLLKVKCPVCGALQKRVEQGYNHLILDSELKNTYNMLADFLRDGYLALCMSTTFPEKLKRTYNLSGKLKCIWLTNAGGKDTIDPSNIEKIGEVVEKFAEKYPASVILFDGLEYLVVEHGFDEAIKLVKKMTDVASMMDMTLIVPINPAALTTDELSKLRAEFDRVEALEDKDERTFY